MHVSASVIGDGEIDPPKVGSVLTGALRFHELPADEPDVVRIRARLEPSGDDPTWQVTGDDSQGWWEWEGLLRDDGWTASWRGVTPRTGEVELTGQFRGVFSYDTVGRFRGRVTRVRLVCTRYQYRPGSGWAPVVPRHRTLRDVDSVPQMFGFDAIAAEGAEYSDMENSVVVDLDLDDVPPLPARPSIVPGSVSSANGVLWVSDAELPLIVSIGADDVVAEHVVPGRIGVARQICATPTGCWVTGPDGTYWIAIGHEPIRVDDLAVHAAAVVGETLLVCGDGTTWRIYSPGVEPVDVAAVGGYVASVVADEGGFVAVVLPGGAVARLVRVTRTGESTIGPDIALLPRGHGRPYLGGEPLRLVRGVDVGVVQPGLGVRDVGERLGRHQLHGGRAGRFLWTVGHSPDGTSSGGWWPLPGPVTFERTEQFWLLTVYDGRTLRPLTSVPVSTSQPAVTIDDDGLVSVTAGGVQQFRVDSPVMQPPVELDVAGVLDRCRAGS
ncbi:hypothetical protein GCM10007304_46560 [Rhodococcoides trifolii]|uniref:Uncharacterized protein n=1 Tax=Rhodococcoides trifolii TaxID=908250 RepID=A0A917LI83_9NOCA|nr:hypothetical protein GCM10007304_46560 [Rhodococcus trifolii]